VRRCLSGPFRVPSSGRQRSERFSATSTLAGRRHAERSGTMPAMIYDNARIAEPAACARSTVGTRAAAHSLGRRPLPPPAGSTSARALGCPPGHNPVRDPRLLLLGIQPDVRKERCGTQNCAARQTRPGVVRDAAPGALTQARTRICPAARLSCWACWRSSGAGWCSGHGWGYNLTTGVAGGLRYPGVTPHPRQQRLHRHAFARYLRMDGQTKRRWTWLFRRGFHPEGPEPPR